jgi:SAM-dependent methyltransferase
LLYRYRESEASYWRLRATRSPVDYAGRSFDDFDLRSFLDSALRSMVFSDLRPCAFEYGTGTGAGACFLAARGFEVDAIDISPTAIALAQRFASERHLKVAFAVADITRMTPPGPLYDLVVDNFCLQYVIREDERHQVLRTVRDLLKKDGYFVIGTVPYRDGRDFGPDRFDPSSGIVYRRLPVDSAPCEEAVLFGGEWFAPWRRLVLRPEALRLELEAAGFRVLHQDGARCLCDRASEHGPGGGVE